MKSAEELYRKEVRLLTATERLRLARMILDELEVEPTLRDSGAEFRIGNLEEEVAYANRGTGRLNPPTDDLG